VSQDRTLVNAIKAQFARKSTAAIQVISQAVNHDRWSVEAVLAAGELLEERRAGVAYEPDEPDDTEYVPREDDHDPELALLGVLFGLVEIAPMRLIRRIQATGLADSPVPFGPNMAWLAISGHDTEAVVNTLGLRKLAQASWEQGVEAAHRGSVFVTPPVGDWTLVLGTPLFHPPDRTAEGLEMLLETLSRQFEEVQYLASLKDAGLFVWGQARQGKVLRGYGWLGAQQRELWNVGKPTAEELLLGFRFGAGIAPVVESAEGSEPTAISEEDLFQLASRWSVDPMTLSVEFAEPVSGLLGQFPSGTTFERRRLE